MRVFYINLDRAPERRAHMNAELLRAGLGDDAVRHPATDARTMAPSRRYRPRSWGPYWTLLDWEVAVFEAHRAVWSRIADEGLRAAAILEDDVVLSTGLAQALGDLSAHAGAYDVAKLDGAPGPVRLGPVTRLGGTAVRPVEQVLVSAAAYTISGAGARRALEASARFCDHIDDFLTRPRVGWRAVQLDPALAVQGMFLPPERAARVPGTVALSERERANPVRAGYQRGPAPYRMWKEARRARRRLVRAAWSDRRLVAAGGRIGPIPLADDLGGYG